MIRPKSMKMKGNGKERRRAVPCSQRIWFRFGFGVRLGCRLWEDKHDPPHITHRLHFQMLISQFFSLLPLLLSLSLSFFFLSLSQNQKERKETDYAASLGFNSSWRSIIRSLLFEKSSPRAGESWWGKWGFVRFLWLLFCVDL